MVFVCNPNNPTGTYVPSAEVARFVESVPDDVMVVIDEAYIEFVTAEDREGSLEIQKAHDNVVVLRTFSKIYGLCGLRTGYGICAPEVKQAVDKVRQPFNVNNLALVAAIAALDDEPFLRKSHELNLAGLAQLTGGFKRLGLAWIPSFANFVTVEIPREAGASRAGIVYQQLLRAGVIVRPVAGYALPDHLRVTVGLPEENERFLTALAAARGKP